jgi:hypothetical protein
MTSGFSKHKSTRAQVVYTKALLQNKAEVKDVKQTSRPEVPFKLGQVTIYIFLLSHTIKFLIIHSRVFKPEMFT